MPGSPIGRGCYVPEFSERFAMESRTMLVQQDIAYLESDRSERLDFYRPARSERPLPVVIFAHGGAFHEGSKSEERSRLLSELMAGAGLAVLSIDYALSESSSGAGRWSAWPRNLLDVAAAVAFVRKSGEEMGLDRERIILSGASAGATLALLAAFGCAEAQGAAETARHIRAVVNFYGRVDWQRYTVADKQPESQEDVLAASPVHWIERANGGPPILTLHGCDDAVVPVEQARMLDDCLRACGISHDLHELKGLPHAFSLPPDRERIAGPLLGFLSRTFAAEGLEKK